MKKVKQNRNVKRLESADPTGRVDVCAYRATKRVLEAIENKYQLPGLAEEMKSLAADEISRHLTDKKLNLPPGSLPILRRLGIV